MSHAYLFSMASAPPLGGLVYTDLGHLCVQLCVTMKMADTGAWDFCFVCVCVCVCVYICICQCKWLTMELSTLHTGASVKDKAGQTAEREGRLYFTSVGTEKKTRGTA